LKGLLKKIRESLGTAKGSGKGLSSRGILIFRHTSEVIQAERLLRDAGLDVRVVGPPPQVRTGCDLAIEFPLIARLHMAQVLEDAAIEPMDVLPLQDVMLEPVSLYHVKDFGDHLMVRAANMKLTVAKKDLRIVNVSGGGCPDVPYLAEMLVGKTLLTAPEPRQFGSTLCGYALQLAYEELKRQCRG
jgi:hypothetical protein